MNQIEIAKKILEQGDCKPYSAICSNGCPFNEGYGIPCTVDEGRDKNKVKQWLKERESMIDLNKNQIVEPMVKCWVSFDGLTYSLYELCSIDHRGKHPYTVIVDGWKTNFPYCSLTDPNKPKVKKWETVMDVPPELWGKALVKRKDARAYSSYIMTPVNTFGSSGKALDNMHYLPLGQPLDGEWLEFESEVIA